MKGGSVGARGLFTPWMIFTHAGPVVSAPLFHGHVIVVRLRGHKGMELKEEERVAGQAGGEEGARCGPPEGREREEKEKTEKRRRRG